LPPPIRLAPIGGRKNEPARPRCLRPGRYRALCPSKTHRHLREAASPRSGAWCLPLGCAQGRAKLSVFLMPLQLATVCGGFQRSGPMGGAANGMPLNEDTPLSEVPSITPPVTDARRISALAGDAAASSVATGSKNMRRFIVRSGHGRAGSAEKARPIRWFRPERTLLLFGQRALPWARRCDAEE